MAKKLLIDPHAGLGYGGSGPYGVMAIGDPSVDFTKPGSMPFGQGKVDFHSSLYYLRLRQLQRHNLVLPALSRTQNTYACSRANVDTGTMFWQQTYSTVSFGDLLQSAPPMAFVMIERDIIPGMAVIQTAGDSYRAVMSFSEVGKVYLHCWAVIGDQPLPPLPMNVLVYFIEDPLRSDLKR